jgi:hypothetical protein
MYNKPYQEPAFSRAGHEWSEGGSWVPARFEQGMTLRDYFAAKALAALIAQIPDRELDHKAGAKDAYRYADAMMGARK